MFVLQEYSCDPNDTVFVKNYNLSTQIFFAQVLSLWQLDARWISIQLSTKNHLHPPNFRSSGGWHLHLHFQPLQCLSLPSAKQNPSLRSGFAYCLKFKLFSAVLMGRRLDVFTLGQILSPALWMAQEGAGGLSSSATQTPVLSCVLALSAWGQLTLANYKNCFVRRN